MNATLTGTMTRPLTAKEVTELIGCTRKTLDHWVAAGIFPPPTFKGRGRNGKLFWSREMVRKALDGEFKRPAAGAGEGPAQRRDKRINANTGLVRGQVGVGEA
jgi:predicted DNA-binding transcriptional regulator AlpA